MFNYDYSAIPDDITRQWLEPLPLATLWELKGVSKTFYDIINEMNVKNSFSNCKIKDYVKTVKERFPKFIIQHFEVKNFAKIAFKSIETNSAIVKDDPELMETISIKLLDNTAFREAAILVGQLDSNESFFSFTAQEYHLGECQNVTLLFFSSTTHTAFWHYEYAKSSKLGNVYTPLIMGIEHFNPTTRYEKYEEMLTALFEKKSWGEFGQYSNNQTESCYLRLSPELLTSDSGNLK